MWPLSEVPKVPIDFPLTAGFEFGVFVGMVWVFFILHRRPRPVVLILGISPFVVLSNLICRLFYKDFIGTTDVPMFACLFLSYCSTVYYASINPAAYRGSNPPDAFDRWQNKILGLAVLTGIVLLITYGIRLYGERTSQLLSLSLAEKRGYVKAVSEQKQRDSLAILSRDSIKIALREKGVKDSLWHAYVRRVFAAQMKALNSPPPQPKKQIPKTVIIYQPAPVPYRHSPPPATINRPVELPLPKPKPSTKVRQGKYGLMQTEESDTTETITAGVRQYR